VSCRVLYTEEENSGSTVLCDADTDTPAEGPMRYTNDIVTSVTDKDDLQTSFGQMKVTSR
jgi:hypothetical protein